VGDLRTGRYKDYEHLIFVAHLPWCATECFIFVAHPPWCATEYHISMAHMILCATKCLISVAQMVLCARKIVKSMIGADRLWGAPYFRGACLFGAPQK
jgi:hypothetical protein